jgi:hypothetical protein
MAKPSDYEVYHNINLNTSSNDLISPGLEGIVQIGTGGHRHKVDLLFIFPLGLLDFFYLFAFGVGTL